MSGEKSTYGFFKNSFLVRLILGVLLIVLGLYLLLANSEHVLAILIVIFGIGSIITGARELFQQSIYAEFHLAHTTSVIVAVVDLVVGILVLVYPHTSASIAVKAVFYLLAIQLAVSGISNAFMALTVKRKSGLPILSQMILALVDILLAIICIMFSADLASIILKIIGVGILVGGIGMFLYGLRLNRLRKEAKAKTIEGDVEPLE
ncbi:MAG: DUF308 domain-containing protein [Spirochaetia bacterium]|jgi:uncharacterized membrane protein HdeD (DUF308 family)|nr:DUF308 domain-containing protein [Spirochaetia bacterium]